MKIALFFWWLIGALIALQYGVWSIELLRTWLWDATAPSIPPFWMFAAFAWATFGAIERCIKEFRKRILDIPDAG